MVGRLVDPLGNRDWVTDRTRRPKILPRSLVSSISSRNQRPVSYTRLLGSPVPYTLEPRPPYRFLGWFFLVKGPSRPLGASTQTSSDGTLLNENCQSGGREVVGLDPKFDLRGTGPNIGSGCEPVLHLEELTVGDSDVCPSFRRQVSVR